MVTDDPLTFNSLKGRIRKCAELAGSGHALAQLSGIPRRTLETYLSGHAEPKASRLQAIADATGVTSDWLLCGSGPMFRNSGRIAPPSLNIVLLEQVLRHLEELLCELGKPLPADKKAQMVSVLYDLCQQSSTPPARDQVARILRLID